jgi:predicted phosphodiesterase
MPYNGNTHKETMKLKVLSDLHLEHFVACQVFNVGEGNVLILAGDILCAKHFKTDGYLHAVYDRFLNDCSNNYDKVLYVMGNHEFYGYNYEGTKKKLKENLPHNFHLLDNDTITINNWNFIGFTFWTDFRNENAIEMMEAECNMNDYEVIRIGSKFRKMRADDTLTFHKESKNYLLNQLQTLNDNVFVISHHAPSYQSVAAQFKNEANGAYVSNLDDLIINHPQIKYWVHGHTHTHFDYMIEGCRIICNPGGYPGQNTGFFPDKIFDI